MFMKSRLFGVKCVLCGLLPFQKSNYNEKQTENPMSIYDRERSSLPGSDRLYRMFSVDEVGSFSPELITSYQATIFGAFLGATYGGYLSTKSSPEKPNSNPLALKRKFHQRNISPNGKEVIFNFVKGGFNWGWRVSLLCGSLTLFSTAASVYRGQSGILEYTLTGAVVGPWLGWKGGLRSKIMGGLLGIVLGTAGGCVLYATHTLSGTTTEENRFWRYGWKETQLKHSREKLRKLKEESSVFVENNEEDGCDSANSNKPSNQLHNH